MARTPTIDVLTNLSRTDWEELCASICAIIYQAERVEDRLGRGNGLDGWRKTLDGIEGFQHRRLNGRFGDSQVHDLKKNIELAVSRCPNEMGEKLVRYRVFLNIDLQPSHKGAMGEIERWQALEKWALDAYGVQVHLHGVTWVLARLKENPKLLPELFEDVSQAIADMHDDLSSRMDSNLRILEELQRRVEAATFEQRLRQMLVKLAHEARIHFERGVTHGEMEEYRNAIVSLDDARRLVELETVDEALRGHILLMLCGVKTMMGYLTDALADGEKAVARLKQISDRQLLHFARGNVAYVLYQLQRYDEAKPILEELLSEYEHGGDLVEIVRTLQHLAELSCNQNDIKAAAVFCERLERAAKALVEVFGGIEPLTLGALGTSGNVWTVIGRALPPPLGKAMLQKAHDVFEQVAQMASMLDSAVVAIRARGGKARALWLLNDLESAAALYEQVAGEARTLELHKNAADAQFNHALILNELGRREEGRALLLEARRYYVEMGDVASVHDVDRVVAEQKK